MDEEQHRKDVGLVVWALTYAPETFPSLDHGQPQIIKADRAKQDEIYSAVERLRVWLAKKEAGK